MYYRETYPFLKFLTVQELERICKKYKLVYAPVQHYKGDVPYKNLLEIKNAQPLKSEDIQTKRNLFVVDKFWNSVPGEIKRLLSKPVLWNMTWGTPSETTVRTHLLPSLGYKGSYKNYIYVTSNLITIDYGGLYIAAPKSEFEDLDQLGSAYTNGGYIRTTIRTYNDPIVYRYCRGGVQVLSKWGLEASDPDLVLPINN